MSSRGLQHGSGADLHRPRIQPHRRKEPIGKAIEVAEPTRNSVPYPDAHLRTETISLIPEQPGGNEKTESDGGRQIHVLEEPEHPRVVILGADPEGVSRGGREEGALDGNPAEPPIRPVLVAQ